MQWSAGSGWYDERDGPGVREKVDEDVATMDQILKDAEMDDWYHENIMERVAELPDLSHTKSLHFYSICVQAGYLTSNHARRESYFALISDRNPGGARLAEKGCPDLQKGLQRLAWWNKQEQYIMENILCKTWRAIQFCWDYVADGQTMYCRSKVTNEKGQERTIFLKKEWGREWQEYTPELRGFKEE